MDDETLHENTQRLHELRRTARALPHRGTTVGSRLRGTDGIGTAEARPRCCGSLPAWLQPTCGRIERAAHTVIGYLPQYRHIDRQFPTTVADIVLSGMACRKKLLQPFTAAHKEQVERTLEQFHLKTSPTAPSRI